jgi:hypothetical protein
MSRLPALEHRKHIEFLPGLGEGQGMWYSFRWAIPSGAPLPSRGVEAGSPGRPFNKVLRARSSADRAAAF